MYLKKKKKNLKNLKRSTYKKTHLKSFPNSYLFSRTPKSQFPQNLSSPCANSPSMATSITGNSKIFNNLNSFCSLSVTSIKTHVPISSLSFRPNSYGYCIKSTRSAFMSPCFFFFFNFIVFCYPHLVLWHKNLNFTGY